MLRKGYYDYSIDSRDTDYTGHATLTAMCHYILEAAAEDADLNGFGVADLNCGNCSWVLSRMAVEFGRRLSKNDRFTVRTWVSDVSRMMTTRNMTITAEDGSHVASAVTLWAIIDLEKRIAVDVRPFIDCSKAVIAEPMPIEKPCRIGQIETRQSAAHQVAYSDIDFNRHVGSLKYMEWMLDMLPEEYFEKKQAGRVDINFLHEARYGQTVAINYEQRDESLFEITDNDGQAMCRASFRWRDTQQ